MPINYLQIFLDNDENISLKNRNSTQLLESTSSKYVPWDNVFNNKADNQLHKQPLVPTFEPFNVLEFEQKTNIRNKKEPPFRPPPPKIPSNKKKKSSTKIENKEILPLPNSNKFNFNNSLNESLTEKCKVVQDLLTTEIVYLFDLNAWELVNFQLK